MIIKKIEIHGFGKLENFSMDLEEGLQVIYGSNESGKSTLMEFIKRMFYTRCGGEKLNSKDKELRKKYLPWSGKKISGAIEFVYEKNLYRVEKELGESSSSQDKVKVKNLFTNEILELGKRTEVGEYFFGIDVKSFERSSYIGETGRANFNESTRNSKDGIADKILSNISGITEDEASEKTALKNIDSAIRELQWLRGNGGKIFDTRSDINQLNYQILNLEYLQKKNLEVEKEFSKIKQLLSEKKNLNFMIEKIKKYKNMQVAMEIKKLLEEKNKLEDYSQVINNDEIIQNLNHEKEEIDNLKIKVKEIKNVLKNLNQEKFIKISDGEVKILEDLIEERLYTEYKINYINKVLINGKLEGNYLKNIKCDDSQCIKIVDEWVKNKQISNGKIIELEKKIENERKRLAELSNDIESNSVTGNLNGYIMFAEIANVLIFLSSVVYGAVSKSFFLLKLYFFPFITVLLYGIYQSIKIGKKTKFINEQKQEQKLVEDKVEELLKEENKISLEFSKIDEKIKNTLSNYEKNFKEKSDVIENVIFEKKCNSVREYFINYEKSKSIKNIIDSYKNELNKLNLKESEFVKSVSRYANVVSIKEATEFLDTIAKLKLKLHSLNEKISIKSEYLNFTYDSIDSLNLYINNLKESCSDDINLDNDENIERRYNELNSLNLEEKYIELQKKLNIPHANKEELLKKLNKKKENLKGMESYLQSLKIAKKVIEECSEEMRKIFSPTLNSRASEIFSDLTGKKYGCINISKEYDIFIEHGLKETLCENFSSGTLDQAYFALRIAIAEMISGKSCLPIILDDTFRQYDSKRLDRVLKFLSDYKKGFSQSIIFTCHKSLVESAKLKGARIIMMPADS